MKIIAVVKEGEYLVNLKGKEISRIIGKNRLKEHNEWWRLNRSRTDNLYETGQEFDVNCMWEFMDKLFCNREKLSDIADRLTEFADLIRGKQNVFLETIENKKRDEVDI